MNKIMKVNAFVEKLLWITNNVATLYVMGCFGAPLISNSAFNNVKRYKNNHIYNQNPIRQKMISGVANRVPPVFGFDCVNLIKGVCWGFNADPTRQYGGAVYATNGLGDINETQMIALCPETFTDFKNVSYGAAVWLPGHIGIYIGNGKVVECTPRWRNCVQITNLTDRQWVKWGKLPFIDYTPVGEEWKDILRKKTSSPEKWIEFVEEMSVKHPMGQWLDELIVKLSK